MGALSPDRLVRVAPLENLCGCSPTRCVGERDSTTKFVRVFSHQILLFFWGGGNFVAIMPGWESIQGYK